ncbi:MAG: aldehyde dehydrogenase EutE [Chloroflexi bacterium]|nr:aldehyde dehydrogenase EutE [Chloroflexota bacterium]
MSQLSDRQIEQIAQRVLTQIEQRPRRRASASTRAPHLSYVGRAGREVAPPRAAGRDGIYADIDAAVAAARRAFVNLDAMTLAKRKEIIAAMRTCAREHAEVWARMAHEETGLGRAEDKIQKNLLVADKTPGPELLEPTAWTGDRGLTLTEWAPYGVVAAITPSTNPTSTIINNAISIISAGNAVVFNVHPGAKRVSNITIQELNRAIVAAGGPADLLTAPAEPTIESAQALMRHPGVRLLLVTGGPAVVREAMKSGKRAICAGPGNPPVVVDETADIEKAGRDIVFGASFDNNIICVDEKEAFVVDRVVDELKRVMLAHGAVELPRHRLSALEKVIFKELKGPRKPGVIDKKWVGKDAGLILKEIGIHAPDARLVLVETPIEHPLIWTEQLMPVFPIARVRSADEGIDLAVEAEHGFGHTASMFSRNIDNLSRMARLINCSIFVKNGPNLAGLGYGGEGYTSMSIASPTGEGLTNAISFSRPRRCTLVDHFRIV